MQTITIELLDDQAIGLLQQLEKIHWLRIIRKPEAGKIKQEIKDKTLPKSQEELVAFLLKQIEEIRNHPRPKQFLSDMEHFPVSPEGVIPFDRASCYEDRIQLPDIR